jgi:hypothetical protein
MLKAKASSAWSRRPTLEPTTFYLNDEMEAAAWTVVHHKKKQEVSRWG